MEPSLEHRRREADQFAEHRSRRIVRDAGSIEVCRGEGGTGRCVIVHARHDGCLDILDIVEEAEVAQALERVRSLPLAGRVPYKVRLDGKWWTFEATYRWPLIGVCRPDRNGTLLLLSSVGAGLMITGILKSDMEESRFAEDWRATFDLDLDLDADEVDGHDVDAGTNAHARAAEQARVRTVEAARRVGARRSKPTPGEAVQTEYARLGCGRGPDVAPSRHSASTSTKSAGRPRPLTRAARRATRPECMPQRSSREF
ncbi:hypothetical protein [Nannocystis sp.]|uniref:hypothetical protein n=1 Tax=Nannocystis sp. TaxID=1962667 RepID=UPI0025D0A167|nr:hypothetical protein [Nannocystis sp.]MBK7829374.1 hypothetical protein [Nannocystis sp.]